MVRIKNYLQYIFMAVTWNVYFGTDTKRLEPVLHRLLKLGVTLFLMQEAAGRDIDRMLRSNGLRWSVFGEYRVAWDPSEWEYIGHRERLVSKTPMFRTGSTKPVYIYVIVVRLRHIATGRRIKVISYHTPSHVQRPEWNRDAPNRWRILKDAMALFGTMARNSVIPHILFGGDDNVDETNTKGIPKGRFNFLTPKGLRLIHAPKPTHAGGRKIDDFRVKGLEPVGEGVVGEGGGDHNFFAQKFQFVGRFMKRLRRNN